MAGQFIITRGGRDRFVTDGELAELAQKGQLQPGDLVYHPILGRWLYAREVEEIKPWVVASQSLGRPVVSTPMRLAPANGEAIAGFAFGVLGHLPLIGLVFCLLGIFFSTRGLRRAPSLEMSGHGLAVAGLVLSTLFLMPAMACSLLLF